MTVRLSLRLAAFLFVATLAGPTALARTPARQYLPPAGFSPGQAGVDPQGFVDPMLEGSVEIYGFGRSRATSGANSCGHFSPSA